MSWKNTDPLELWKTSTTLPVPAKNQPSVFGEPKFGSAKTRFWASLNEMNPTNRARFFKEMLKSWPYKWERRAIIWSVNSIPLTTMASSLYISTKITADVFLVQPNMGFVECFRVAYKKAPTLLTPAALGILAQWTTYRTIFQPYIEHEGQLSKQSLLLRACFAVTVFGIIFPVISVPPMANSIYNSEQRKIGMRPYPNGSVVDLVSQTFECTRSIWRRLPIIIGINIFMATAAISAMIWSTDRIHTTIDIDAELIQSLMEEREQKKSGERKSIIQKLIIKLKTFKQWMDETDMGKVGGVLKESNVTGWRDYSTGMDVSKAFGGKSDV